MHAVLDEIFSTKNVHLGNGRKVALRDSIDVDEVEFITTVITEHSPMLRGVEVGCAFGVSAAVICTSAIIKNRDYHHTIIDPFQMRDFDGGGLTTLKRCGFSNYDLIEQPSEYALPKLASQFPGGFDFAFIDGFHTFDHTLLDLYYCMRLLRVGGVIIVDDCRMPPVAKAISYVQKLPSMITFRRSASHAKTFNEKKYNLLNGLLPGRLSRLLPVAIYDRLLPRGKMPPMIALKKVSEDVRGWNWHCEF